VNPSRFFPSAETADADGLLGVGGQLTPDWLLDAYGHGIFPWPIIGSVNLLAWWSLDPRAVIVWDRFHVSRRLRRTCRNHRFTVTCDRDFRGVILGCATASGREGQTWLTAEMIAAYVELFRLGHAHSVEVWSDGALAGGTYGLAMGGLFSAESMFHRVTDASKVALVHLVAHLQARGYPWMDIQQLTPHSARFGAVEIPRSEYLQRLDEALAMPVTFGSELVCYEEHPAV
jgi:leucyl/phenylalanyl-tRNA--protein transferase